jgi:hypothetical protein
MATADLPAAVTGILVTHFLTVRDIPRASGADR